MSLLRRAGYRHQTRHPWQLALSILGIALGVAVVAAMDIAIGSARRAFELSTEAVTGRATHEVVGGPAGLADSIYRRLRVEHGLRPSAPVVEGYVRVGGDAAESGETLRLIGLDPFAERPFRSWLGGRDSIDVAPLLTTPGAVLLAASTARQLRLEPGDTFQIRVAGRSREAVLAGTMIPADEVGRSALEGLLLADISTAQELLGRAGRIDRIEVIAEGGAAGDSLIARLRSLLPAGAMVQPTGARRRVAAELTAAFELNLRSLSLLGLVFGGFLIYNAMTFSVVQRREVLGILRTLGVTRRQIFTTIVAEAVVIGAVASALGLIGGAALGEVLVGLVTRTINDLYFVVSVREATAPPAALIKAAVLGVFGTVLAALAPAREAAAAAPQHTLSRSALESGVRASMPRLTAAAGALLLLGVAALVVPSRSIGLSFVGLFALIFGAALLTPVATLVLMRLARPLLGRALGMLGRMAAGDVTASLSRTAPAIAALSIAVAVGIAVGLMVASFRLTVERWLGQTLLADVYVSAPGPAANRAVAAIDPAILARIAALEGVAGMSTYRHVTVKGATGTVQLTAVDLVPRQDAAFQFVDGDARQALREFRDGKAVLVSEPFAYRNRLGAGDTLRLRSDLGLRPYRIAGVFSDYASEQGVVFMQRTLYMRGWEDPAVNAAAIFTAAGTRPEAVAARIREAGPEQALFIRTSGALRQASLDVFDRTFAITSVLRILALIVAFVGVVSALMALSLERARQLGVLRAAGLTPGQLRGLVVTGTGLIGLVAAVLAIPVGITLAAAMVLVVNRRSFGWTMPLEIDPAILLEGLLLALAAAFVAGVYPAWRMARTPPAEALREE